MRENLACPKGAVHAVIKCKFQVVRLGACLQGIALPQLALELGRLYPTWNGACRMRHLSAMCFPHAHSESGACPARTRCRCQAGGTSSSDPYFLCHRNPTLKTVETLQTTPP